MKLNFTIETTNQTELQDTITLLSTMLLSTPTKPVEEKTTPKATPSTPKKKKAVTKPVEPTEEKAKDITLGDLKDIAQAAVAKSSREDVKKVISKYGEKLSAVDARMYNELATELKGL